MLLSAAGAGSALPNRKHRVTLEPQGPRPIVLLFMSTNLFDAVFAAGRDSQTAVLCDQRDAVSRLKGLSVAAVSAATLFAAVELAFGILSRS